MLTVEDGTIVAAADTYVEITEFVEYATNHGVTIPDDDVEIESVLRRAYIKMAGMAWIGSPVSGDQSGAWPRFGGYRNGFLVDSGSIPAQIKLGQMALAAEIYADDLDPPEGRRGAVKSETVGDISVTYATAPNYKARPVAGRRSSDHFSGYLNSSSVIQVRRG